MKPFTTASVVVFSLVALLQMLRVAMGWDVVIAGILIPPWASVIACVVAATLAFKVWREKRTLVLLPPVTFSPGLGSDDAPLHCTGGPPPAPSHGPSYTPPVDGRSR